MRSRYSHVHRHTHGDAKYSEEQPHTHRHEHSMTETHFHLFPVSTSLWQRLKCALGTKRILQQRVRAVDSSAWQGRRGP